MQTRSEYEHFRVFPVGSGASMGGLKYPRLVFLIVGSYDLAAAYYIKNIARHPPYI